MKILDRFSKNEEIQNFIKIRPVGAELFHQDRHTDEQAEGNDEATVAARNFANVPKIPSSEYPIIGPKIFETRIRRIVFEPLRSIALCEMLGISCPI